MKAPVFLLLLVFPFIAAAQYTSSISGHVSVKRAGASAQGISVILTGPYTFPRNYNSSNSFTTTDSTGYYHFGRLSSGTYYLSFNPAWDRCFYGHFLTDTIEVKSDTDMVHDYVVDELSSDRDWMADYGKATITTHVVDVHTGLPAAHVSIDIFRLEPNAYGMKYLTMSEYRDYTDSTGTFTTLPLCHGIYELRYYYYVDGRRDYLAQDSLFVMPDAAVKLERYVDLPVSVRPTSSLPMADVGLHFGLRPTAELSFGVGHIIAEHKLMSFWETATGGCEFGFQHNQLIIGPKVTYNWSGAFLLCGIIGGGSLIYYTDFTHSNFFLHPQFGVTLQTIFDIYIGGNIPLHYEPFNSSVNTFTITLAVELMNWKRLDL